MVVGKTGVGKSTLINSIFRGDFAKTGSGAPVTQGIEEITKPGHPLTIIDTKGIEVADYQKILDDLDEVINNRTQSIDPNVHIHAAWICINCKSSRVEAAEVDLCNYLNSKNIPVITVITKSGKKDPFIQKVKELLPNANATIPVRAQDEEDHDEEPPRIMKSHGLNELIRETAKLIPESQKRAFSAALNTRNAQALEVKREVPRRFVWNLSARIHRSGVRRSSLLRRIARWVLALRRCSPAHWVCRSRGALRKWNWTPHVGVSISSSPARPIA